MVFGMTKSRQEMLATQFQGLSASSEALRAAAAFGKKVIGVWCGKITRPLS